MQEEEKKKGREEGLKWEREKKILIPCGISQPLIHSAFPGDLFSFFLFVFSFETFPIGSYLKEKIKWLATLNQYGNFYAYIWDFPPTLQPADLDKGGRADTRIQC